MAMQSNDRSLTIEELAEQAQTSVRTVRYYITENLLPGPGSRGKGAAYTEEHLQRLRLIRRLTERRAPLAEIRDVMARVTDDEVRALLAEEDARAQTLDATQAVSPKAYIAALLDRAHAPQTPSQRKPQRASYAPTTAPLRVPPPPQTPPTSPASGATQASAWRRVELAPGVELHIAEEAERRYRPFIERLLQTPIDDLDEP
ncbi:MAG TPA: MerR family transcriptional regulator [Ktedonobacterales bacterium]|jgi:DNA-binding transcriptional MerR regulator